LKTDKPGERGRPFLLLSPQPTELWQSPIAQILETSFGSVQLTPLLGSHSWLLIAPDPTVWMAHKSGCKPIVFWPRSTTLPPSDGES
jgi:hypothetical protein